MILQENKADQIFAQIKHTLIFDKMLSTRQREKQWGLKYNKQKTNTAKQPKLQIGR